MHQFVSSFFQNELTKSHWRDFTYLLTNYVRLLVNVTMFFQVKQYGDAHYFDRGTPLNVFFQQIINGICKELLSHRRSKVSVLASI